MKLSTKSTYGLRAMLNIAMVSKGTVSITDIARREGISVAYLEQLLNKLRRSGLIKSVRGPKGGYMLAKDASDITVSDVVDTLEGGIYPVHCVGSKRRMAGSCKKSEGCVPKIVWQKLAKAINDCLQSINLADLCREVKNINIEDV